MLYLFERIFVFCFVLYAVAVAGKFVTSPWFAAHEPWSYVFWFIGLLAAYHAMAGPEGRREAFNDLRTFRAWLARLLGLASNRE